MEIRREMKGVIFENIVIPENANIVIKNTENIKFVNVRTLDRAKPNYEIRNGVNIIN